MYDTQIIAERIKERAKVSNFSMKEMFSDLGLGINTVSHLAKGQEISYLKIAKIADYLECSVDYLLGRSDTPNMSNSVDNSVLINGSINNSNHSTLNVATPPQDEMTQQLIDGFKTLSFENKLKIMNTLFELKKES